jgi:hypothetical protein
MGHSFSNFQIRSSSLIDVHNLLREVANSKVYTSRSENGWISVYPEETETGNVFLIESIGERLSKELNSTVLSFNVFDSYLLQYFVFQQGICIDRYISHPLTYSESEIKEVFSYNKISKFDSKILHSLCMNLSTSENRIKEIISSLIESPEDLICELALHLGLSDVKATSGFYDVENGYALESEDSLEIEDEYVCVNCTRS